MENTMQLSEFEHFRDLLLERKSNLTEWLDTAGASPRDDIRKVRALLGQIKDAIDRIEGESFGECTDCHGEMEHDRLEVQPVRQVCLDCLSDVEKAALESDLYLASKIHRALLPKTVPVVEGFDIKVQSLAARDIGGDYYDFIPGSDGQSTKVFIADAMGKGLPGGLLISNLQGALRVLSSDPNARGRLVEKLNQWLCRNVPVTKFVSLACVCLENTDEEETRIAYTNAGHCLPILVRKDGSVEELAVTGGVLGVHEEFIYEEKSVNFYSGDLLLLYTDGITEAENSDGEFFEEDRVIEIVKAQRKESPETILDHLIKAVHDFSGNGKMADDITAIILRKK
jgi:sigma-B regulation protein RsbU (phosphoserine phosphatase)